MIDSNDILYAFYKDRFIILLYKKAFINRDEYIKIENFDVIIKNCNLYIKTATFDEEALLSRFVSRFVICL